MVAVSFLVVALQPSHLFERLSRDRIGGRTQPWKQTLLLVCGVLRSRGRKIRERSVEIDALCSGQRSTGCAPLGLDQHVQEVFDATMAIAEQAEWLIEAAIWWLINSDGHQAALSKR